MEPSVVTIAGNRPEIIKLSELVKSFDDRFQNLFVYSGQHYSKNMSDDFFNELGVKIDYNLQCGTSSPDVLTQNIKDFLFKISPKFVILYGDTNTTLSAALAARMANCKIIHIEAGLRCFDQTLVEERNRIKIDSISDYLFAPTELNKVFLKFENIPEDKISVTGNLIVDVCKKYSYRSDSTLQIDPPENYFQQKNLFLLLIGMIKRQLQMIQILLQKRYSGSFNSVDYKQSTQELIINFSLN